MTTQAENAILRYREKLARALRSAPPKIRSEAIQDAEEFLADEVRAMDVGRLTSQAAAYERLIERFGSPEQLASNYMEQCYTSDPVGKLSFRWGGLVAVVLLFVTTGSVCFAMLREPPKLSPFTDVQFEENRVLVEYDGGRYEWRELDGIEVADIVASSQKQFGDRWQKRIAEDLVEVVWGMNHRPGKTVRLKLLNPASGKEKDIAAAKMTLENRQAVWGKRHEAWRAAMQKPGPVAAVVGLPPKQSPFTEVTFEGENVFVVFESKPYQWLEIDDLKIGAIVTSAKAQFGGRWQKRIAEDLVEVLWGMNHHPGPTVRLKLLDRTANQARTVDAATMSKENRQSVLRRRDQAQASLGAELSADSVDHLHQELKARWAYYPRSAKEIDAAITALRSKAGKSNTDVDLPLELQKVIAAGIDGHAAVSGWRLEGNCLPFLIEPIGDRFVAFNADRKSFVDPDHPFIEAIDDVSIEQWLASTSQLIANGSDQLVRNRGVRLLRHVDYWKTQRGLPVTDSIALTLASDRDRSTITKNVSTQHRKPVYGDWPRTESRLLADNIGYLRIESMNGQAVDHIGKRMTEFKGTRGLIVDVRGNGGGSRDALRTLASYLLSADDPPRIVNVAKYRLHPDFDANHLEARFMYPANSKRWSNVEKEAIKEFAKSFEPEWVPPEGQFSEWNYMVLSRLDMPGVYYYNQPVVVLCDSGCFSATDIFLAALKGIPNVTLMGTPSSGGSARSVSFQLSNTNLRIKLASMASFQSSGALYDGNGVAPDILIESNPNYLIGKDDNVLTSAIECIIGN